MRKNFVDDIYHVIHYLGGFAYGQTAYGVAFGAKGGDMFGAFAAQIFVGATLNYGEPCLMVSVEAFGLVVMAPSALHPFEREVERASRVLVITGSGRAFIQGHHDVGADIALYVHDILGREKVTRTIDMTTEVGSLFCEFTVMAQ